MIANGQATAAVSPAVDRELLKRGLRVDEVSRNVISAEFVRSMSDALEQQARAAAGDFRPDTNVQRFLSWENVKAAAASVTGGGAITFDDLLTKWETKKTPQLRTQWWHELAVAVIRVDAEYRSGRRREPNT